MTDPRIAEIREHLASGCIYDGPNADPRCMDVAAALSDIEREMKGLRATLEEIAIAYPSVGPFVREALSTDTQEEG